MEKLYNPKRIILQLVTHKHTKKNKILFTPTETARMLGVCTNTIYSWEKNGKIKAFKTPDGYRRYHISEIKRILYEPKPKQTKGFLKRWTKEDT